MRTRFFGRIPFRLALAQEHDAWSTVVATGIDGVVLGFESEPVITCGVRAGDEDLVLNHAQIAAAGFEIHRVDRGGQATIHNPGQLVIFPIVNVRAIGVRVWVERLAEVTAKTLFDFGVESEWRSDQPGLYTSRGKIMACGVRIRQGVSTHGIAINVSNRLSDFGVIRACGISSAPIDRMGEGHALEDIFNVWCRNFHESQG